MTSSASMDHLILLVPPPMRSATIHYGTFEGGHRSRTRLGQIPQLNWRLPTISREPPKLRDNNNRLGHSKYPRGTSSRAPQVPKSNKLLNFNSIESSWRTQTDATYAMARTLEVLKSFTLKSHESNKCFGGEER